MSTLTTECALERALCNNVVYTHAGPHRGPEIHAAIWPLLRWDGFNPIRVSSSFVGQANHLVHRITLRPLYRI